jgi:hypothetical protein
MITADFSSRWRRKRSRIVFDHRRHREDLARFGGTAGRLAFL